MKPGLLLAACAVMLSASPASAGWIRAWQASPQRPLARDLAMMPRISGVRIEQVIRLAAGGRRVRMRLSNQFATDPLEIREVTVARLGTACRATGTRPRAPVAVRFRSTNVAAGTFAESIPIALRVRPDDCLLVTIDLPGTASKPTVHRIARADAIVAPLAVSNIAPRPLAVASGMRYFLSGVDVDSKGPLRVIVAAGDSITDGVGSTINADRRWPDFLQRRILKARMPFAVVNAGISGNRVLREGTGPSLLARFDGDVLDVPGIAYVILLEGINDLGAAAQDGRMPDSNAVIAGYREIIARAHARGVKVIGATITPYKGASFYSDAGELTRAEINAWIRGPGNFDAVVDFDAAIRDPTDTQRIRGDCHSGDRLHPNDRGFEMLAQAVGLKLFR
ncbi:MAG: SGNH/GDSL hydrolase family protein [Pseudomonadota bacterium]